MKKNLELAIVYSDSKSIIKCCILGFLIGLAVIIPGVSGSTLAMIFMMYDKLLYAIGNITKRPKESFLFLAPILVGAIFGFTLGFLVIQKLMNLAPFTLTALFGGLMLGSLTEIQKKIKVENRNKKGLFLLLIGILIPIMITTFSIVVGSTEKTLIHPNWIHFVFFILLGLLISLTQIIPGLSATALLMSIGYFHPILEAAHLSYLLENKSILLLFINLILGFTIGLVLFSKLIHQILHRYQNNCYYIFLGLSIGSIISMFYNIDIIQLYEQWIHYGLSWDFYIGILLCGIGIWLGYRISQHSSS